ncbi:MAG: SDR family oxidoreductase [Geminicoccaceae bacterium]
MSGRVQSKNILVTAAAQGIGRSSALALAAEGARVLATDINLEALAELKAESDQITVERLDARDSDSVAAVVRDHGPFDGLFNCAGFVHHGTLLDVDESAWDFSFDLNVKSMWRTCRAILPGMIEAGGGSIVNMSSVASSMKGAPNRCLYGTTKAAVIGLTKAIAVDFIQQGVRCNAICPGTVQTPSLEERLHSLGDYEQARAAFIARQPMGRLGTAEEIAALVVYLMADESAYTTGQAHIIDGGWAL